jgi:alcohol oxidase
VLITFDDSRRVSGVEFRPNPMFQADQVQDSTRIVKARKLVVVSCGTLGTPPILERSGVGNSGILEQVGIPLVVDLPGMGHDYQDHNLSICVYKSSLPPRTTTDGIHGGYESIPTLLANQDTILGWNGIDASSKIRPTASEVDKLGDEFKEAGKEDFENTPSKPLVSMIFSAG